MAQTHAEFVKGPAADAGAGGAGAGDAGAGAAAAGAAGGGSDAGAAAAGADAAAAAAAAGAGTAGAAAAGRKAEIEYLEGLVDGKPFQVPKNLQLPYQRGADKVYRPVTEVLKNHINHQDYTAGRARLNETQAEFDRREREFAAREAAAQARGAAFEEERERWLKALSSEDDSPEAERYRNHLRLLRTDPDYKKMYEENIRARERTAEEGVEQEMTRYDDAQSLATDISSYIDKVAANAKYQGIPAEVVRKRYGELVVAGKAGWPKDDDPGFNDQINGIVTKGVLSIFDELAREQQTLTAPVRTEVDTLKAELKALKDAQDATRHNGKTAAELERDRKARAGAPAGGGGAAGAGAGKGEPPKPFIGTPQAKTERHRAWVSKG